MRFSTVFIIWLCLSSFVFISACTNDDENNTNIDGDFDAELDRDQTDSDSPDSDVSEMDLSELDVLETNELETDSSDVDLPETNEQELEQEISTEPFRFAVISDTHLLIADNATSNQYFNEAGQMFSAMQPSVQFVFNTGDMIEDLYCIPGINCSDPLPVLTNYLKNIEENYQMPVYSVRGNHDNRYFGSFNNIEEPIASWRAIFEGTVHYPGEYYSFTNNGFLFVVLNATELAYDHASNDLPSFSESQLNWLKELLSKGLPTFLFYHQFINPELETSVYTKALLDIIENNQNVLATFSGHEHHYAKISWMGVDFYQTDNMGKQEQEVGEERNYPHHLVECDPLSGQFHIVNLSDMAY